MLTKESRDRRVPRKLPRRAAQSVLDSLPENLAVLDRKGVIVSVNRAWKEFPAVNGGMALDRGAVGENYPRLFTDAFGGKAGRARTGAAPAAVLTGEREKFSLEYSCDPPGGKAWFRLSVTPIASGGAVVSHTDVTRQKLAEQQSKRLAVIDPMTGILNRKAGLDFISAQIKISRRHKRKLTVCYIDLDNLKYVNDNFGHREGDKTLRKAVKLIRKVLRESDEMCRLGGDEILLVLPNTTLEEGARVIDRIADRIARNNEKPGVPWKLNISYGLTEYPARGRCKAEELVDAADRNMYRMKMGKKCKKGVSHLHEPC
ncbi:MAG: diguanylate cyclase [Candidatus Dadabacteria bacterium]|nr:MAG: diguanylate cyclase [Candidatus Dadabacteria bacterium]